LPPGTFPGLKIYTENNFTARPVLPWNPLRELRKTPQLNASQWGENEGEANGLRGKGNVHYTIPD